MTFNNDGGEGTQLGTKKRLRKGKESTMRQSLKAELDELRGLGPINVEEPKDELEWIEREERQSKRHRVDLSRMTVAEREAYMFFEFT